MTENLFHGLHEVVDRWTLDIFVMHILYCITEKNISCFSFWTTLHRWIRKWYPCLSISSGFFFKLIFEIFQLLIKSIGFFWHYRVIFINMRVSVCLCACLKRESHICICIISKYFMYMWLPLLYRRMSFLQLVKSIMRSYMTIKSCLWQRHFTADLTNILK